MNQISETVRLLHELQQSTTKALAEIRASLGLREEEKRERVTVPLAPRRQRAKRTQTDWSWVSTLPVGGSRTIHVGGRTKTPPGDIASVIVNRRLGRGKASIKSNGNTVTVTRIAQ